MCAAPIFAHARHGSRPGAQPPEPDIQSNISYKAMSEADCRTTAEEPNRWRNQACQRNLSRQAGKQASRQAGRQAGRQASRQQPKLRGLTKISKLLVWRELPGWPFLDRWRCPLAHTWAGRQADRHRRREHCLERSHVTHFELKLPCHTSTTS